jgi:hypothetical protein
MITAVFEQSRQAAAATYGDFVLGGALWPQSLDFWGENLRPDLYWLYLAMADLYLSLDEGVVWSSVGLSSW